MSDEGTDFRNYCRDARCGNREVVEADHKWSSVKAVRIHTERYHTSLRVAVDLAESLPNPAEADPSLPLGAGAGAVHHDNSREFPEEENQD